MMSTKRKAVIAGIVIALSFATYLFFWSDRATIEFFRSLGANNWSAVVLIISMGAAWAFALPASIFYFVVPLLYDPLLSTLIMVAGSTLGAAAGYIAARYVGGPWVNQFRDQRVTKLLFQHSTFSILFAIRVVPSSPHGFINYGAGLVAVPMPRFLVATALATAVKAYVYASAVHATIGAASLSDALTWKSVASLFAIALLVISGKLIAKKWRLPQTDSPV